jgi:hypothetical protein
MTETGVLRNEDDSCLMEIDLFLGRKKTISTG